MVLANIDLAEILISVFWFYLFFIWILLLFRVFTDVFRSRDMSGASKVLWLVVVMLMPYLGVFAYILSRGSKMVTNEVEAIAAADEANRSYIRDVAGSPSAAAELERLADLHQRGVIDDAELAAMKAKITA